MKECWKIIGCVALIGLLGADIGLQTARIFAPSIPLTELRHDLINSQDRQSQNSDPDYGNYAIGILTLIVLFAQAVIFRKQVRIMRRMTAVYRHQARIMSSQLSVATIAAEAAGKAADAALAALDRPWPLIVEPKHTWREWLSGEDKLYARFMLRNYGDAPCLIVSIKAVLFLSFGPMDRAPFNEIPSIKDFPKAEDLGLFIHNHGITPNEDKRDDGITATIAGIDMDRQVLGPVLFDPPAIVQVKEATNEYFIYAHRSIEPIEDAPMRIEHAANLYLLGRVLYTGPDERSRTIHFCYKAHRSGRLHTIYGAPYNERYNDDEKYAKGDPHGTSPAYF